MGDWVYHEKSIFLCTLYLPDDCSFLVTIFMSSFQMNSCLKNPKILLLKCSIEYLYREETKFTCIDPIVLQVRACFCSWLKQNMMISAHLIGFFPVCKVELSEIV